MENTKQMLSKSSQVDKKLFDVTHSMVYFRSWEGGVVLKLGGDVMLMPFGKYRDEPVEDVPTSYLVWLIGEEFLDDHSPLARAVHQELSERLSVDEIRPDKALARKIVQAGYATVSRKGNQDQEALGLAAAWLYKLLRY